MYAVARNDKVLTYCFSVDEAVRIYQKMKEKEGDWSVLENYDTSLLDTSSCKKFDVEKYLQQANYKDKDGKVNIRFKDMSNIQKRAYLKDRGLSTTRPQKEITIKEKRPPTAIELRYMENGVNMFRWSFFYCWLNGTPTITKTIWDLPISTNVRAVHEGVEANTGWSFIVYDTKKENAIKRVQKYMKENFEPSLLKRETK